MKTAKYCKIITILQIFVALSGLFFAGRQLWLQSLPTEQIASCLPEFSILMQYFPWHEIFSAFLWGTTDCAKINWQWLGFTMSTWSAIYFIVILIVSILIYLNLKHSDQPSSSSN